MSDVRDGLRAFYVAHRQRDTPAFCVAEDDVVGIALNEHAGEDLTSNFLNQVTGVLGLYAAGWGTQAFELFGA